jgi:hypothetical protein
MRPTCDPTYSIVNLFIFYIAMDKNKQMMKQNIHLFKTFGMFGIWNDLLLGLAFINNRRNKIK